MSTGAAMARVGALMGDPTRATLLTRLMDGRAHTPSELAAEVGVSLATVSGHLARLREGGLAAVATQGRRRHYRLASAEAARMLEGVMAFGAAADAGRGAASRTPRALREARTCYDHLAGRVAVAVADALVARGHLVLEDEAAALTPAGRRWLGEMGLDLARAEGARRRLCRPCLDWSERRPHLAGALGAALLDHALAAAWVERAAEGRALRVTALGRAEFAQRFGVETPGR